MQKQMAGKAFDLFRSKGIEPILIKGPAAGIYYPDDDPRNSIDLDIAVPQADFESAVKIARSSDAAGMAIDIHRGLRHLDTKPWNDIFLDSIFVKMGDVDVRIPRPEDHLRVLAVHWLNDGASHKDRLWDIFYLLENRPAGFDWNAVFSPVSPVRRRWISCAIGLAHRYLGLDISSIPTEFRVDDIPTWLTSFVEKEWQRNVIIRPLHVTIDKPSEFLLQVRNRLRMNPVWATVQMEGSLDAPTRLHYRIGSLFSRAPASTGRIVRRLLK